MEIIINTYEEWNKRMDQQQLVSNHNGKFD